MEEYAPEIINIKGINNTVADAILKLDYDPKLNTTNNYTHAIWCGTRGSECATMEVVCTPLAKLQQEQHINRSLLLSYE